MTDTVTSTSDAYIPGVCNINRAEISRRRNAGHLGVAIFVVVLAVMLLTSASRWFHLVLFFPAFLAAIGYLQARGHFCVGYASAGQQNASEGSTAASDIADKAAKAADKARARKMNLQATSIAIAVALICLVIPS